ncbi:MAG: TolC family protein [Nitrospiria bacterium]
MLASFIKTDRKKATYYFQLLYGVTLLMSVIIFCSLPKTAMGEPSPVEISFKDVWSMVQENAPSEKASELELDAIRIENERALREKYPRLYMDVRAYSTDDPVLSFMSVLGQRQLQSSDFAPESLNEPGNQFYQKATLGADWNLYDGGLQNSKLRFEEKTLLAKTYAQKNDTQELYYQTALLYGTAMIFQEQATQLARLLDSTQKLLEHYRIGVKDNPLGYSGLLGLKTVTNKIDELLSENESLTHSAKMALEERAVKLPKLWSPMKNSGQDPILAFVNSYLNPDNNSPEIKSGSPKTQMLLLEAQASELQIEGEKAKTRPRVGLYTEGYVYGGNRDIAPSYVLGLYLKWDLMSSDTYRKADQAQVVANALKARAEDFRLHEKIETESAYLSSLSLKKRIIFMEEDSKLLEEQFQTSKKLYATGSINVLQLVEVINQNIELSSNLAHMETEYLKTIIAQAKGLGLGIPFASEGSENARSR